MNKQYLFLGLIIIFCLMIGGLTSSHLINLIINFIPVEVNIVSLNPSDGFLVFFYSTLAISLFCFILFGGLWLWNFLKNVLFEKEKKLILKSIVPCSVLFFSGFVFGCLMYLLIIIPYFINVNSLFGLENFWSLSSVLNSSLLIGISIGLSFQLPIIIRNAIRFGLIKKELLRKNRLVVLLIIFIVSAVITPPDIISQLLVGLPLYSLFELSLIGVENK